MGARGELEMLQIKTAKKLKDLNILFPKSYLVYAFGEFGVDFYLRSDIKDANYICDLPDLENLWGLLPKEIVVDGFNYVLDRYFDSKKTSLTNCITVGYSSETPNEFADDIKISSPNPSEAIADLVIILKEEGLL